MAAVSVRKSTATLSTVYAHFIILIILCIFNFTVLQANVLPINPGFGIALIALSSVATILGITAQDADDTLLRSFLLVVSVLWTAVGIFHVTEGFSPTGTTDAQALFPGFGAFLLVFIFFVFGSLHHKSKSTAVLSLGYFLACIFEICSLWRPLRTSVGAYYLLLAALALYTVIALLLRKFRQGEPACNSVTYQHDRAISRDYVPLGHAMNTLAFAVFAGQVTGVLPSAAHGFMWILTAGFYQLLAAVVAVRRCDTYNGFYFFLHSMCWLAYGYNLCVEYVTGVVAPPLVAVTVIFFVTFFLVGVASLFREVYQFLQNIALCILIVAINVDGSQGPFLGGMGWILFVISLYGLAAHISRAKNSSFKLPLGMRLIEGQRFRSFLERSCKCCLSCLYGKLSNTNSTTTRRKALFSEDFILGYSKYLDLDVVGFASNAVVILAILWIPQGLWVMPWAIAFGGLTQYIVGSVCFARGLTFESCAFFTFGSMWMIWGPARGLGVLAQDNGPAVIVGCVGFLCVGLLLLVLSLTISKVWTLLVSIFMLVVLGFLLHALAIPATFVYEIVIGILFVLVCMYCFVSTALKTVLGRDVLPFGKPVLQVSYLHSQGSQALWADARRATGVKAIADILNRGGICGIPTDVVYVLVAAVKFPDAVQRAYNTKKLAEDRPMSMWISRTSQLAEGREQFGELVWAFMNEIWPSTVSLVIPKGKWLDNLGIGAANDLIGRPDSIAVRMPDNSVTSYLIDQTGPVAVSSANPTGEADATHHLQVLAKLGLENCDGILCSGPSPENMASTVVDTRRMSEGQLSFFRIGVVPRAQVEAIFDRVRTLYNNNGPNIPPSITGGTTTGGHVNEGFAGDGGDNSSDSGVSGGAGNGSQDGDSGSLGKDDQPLVINAKAQTVGSSSRRNSAGGSRRNSAAPSASSRTNTAAALSTRNSSGEAGAAQETPLEISGHENPVYEDSEAVGNDVSSHSSGRDSLPPSTEDGKLSAPSVNGRFSPETGYNPYEPMVVTPSGAMQIQAGKQIGGRTLTPEPHFRVNPLFTPSSK